MQLACGAFTVLCVNLKWPSTNQFWCTYGEPKFTQSPEPQYPPPGLCVNVKGDPSLEIHCAGIPLLAVPIPVKRIVFEKLKLGSLYSIQLPCPHTALQGVLCALASIQLRFCLQFALQPLPSSILLPSSHSSSFPSTMPLPHTNSQSGPEASSLQMHSPSGMSPQPEAIVPLPLQTRELQLRESSRACRSARHCPAVPSAVV